MSQSKSNSPKVTSQLKPYDNMTPSKQTIFATLAILAPITLLFVALFAGFINP